MERDISRDYFFNKVPDLYRIEEPISVISFIEDSKKRNKDLEFHLLRKITETKRHQDFYVKNTPELQPSNRYSDILPYADTAVKLHDGCYINANWVQVPGDTQKFIATQGPLENTRHAFWQMVFENDCRLIVMISAVREAGVTKCDQYFPQSGAMTVENFLISTESSENVFPKLCVRTIEITNYDTEETRKVIHAQCLAWPDHGVPDIEEDYDCLLYLLNLIRDSLAKPTIVHCSAGIGRTGTLIALYMMMKDIEEMAENAEISVFGTVRKMREQRPKMVQTKGQYSFLYKFMTYYLQNHFKL